MLLRSTRTGAVSIVVYPAQGEPIVNAMPVWGFGVTVPLSARIKPSSRLLAYSFGKVSGTSFSVSGNVVPADAPGSPVGGPGFPGMVGATWHGDQLVWTDGASLAYGVGADATRWVPGASFGEVSRDGSRLLAVLEQEPRQLVLQALAGPMPAQADPALGACAIPYEGTLGDVALAPSGRWVAFVDGRGLNLARAEVPGGGAPCALSGHRIVATNADDPAFSGYTFPAAAPAPPPPAGGGGSHGGGSPGGSGGETGRSGGAAARPKATVARVGLRKALRQGLVVRLSGLRAGRVTVTARLGRTRVASARVRVGAGGRASLRLRFTRAGRRALSRRRSARLTIVAGRARTTVTLK